MVKDDTSIKIKQELEESRKSEALLAKLLENSSQPFGVGYPDGQLGLVNKAFEDLTGYTREELKSSDWSESLTPHKFRDMENEKLVELQRTGQPVRYEKEYIRKDGTRVPIELLVHIVKNEDGTPEYYYSFITDISERKKSEEALQRNEAEISFLLELNDALRQIYDPIQIQETTSRLLGEHLQADRVFYSEIVVKDDIEILVIENDYHRPGVSSLTGQFVFKEFSQTDYEDYRAGRTVSSPNVFTDDREPIQREAYRTVDVSAFIGVPLIKSGELVSVLGVLHRQPRNWTPEEIKLVEQVVERTWHVVQRMRAEKALQESEEKHRRFFESNLIGVIYWNMENKIIDANDKFLEIVGYSREDLDSGRINWSEMTPPEYRYLDEISIAELNETGVNRVPFEKVYIHKDGTHIPILIAGAMLDEARFNGVAFVLDITERKKSEEEVLNRRKVLDAINNVFQEYLKTDTVNEVVQKCLQLAEDLTESEFGFFGEINEKGLLDDRALSPPAWDVCETPNAHKLLKNMEIVSYWGRTIKEEKSQIVNDPNSDPDRRGLPDGHPPITSFLGVPLKDSEKNNWNDCISK